MSDISSIDERAAFAKAFAAQRKNSKNRAKALEARDRRDTRKMGELRAACRISLIEELMATNAAGVVGKADPEYVNAGRG